MFRWRWRVTPPVRWRRAITVTALGLRSVVVFLLPGMVIDSLVVSGPSSATTMFLAASAALLAADASVECTRARLSGGATVRGRTGMVRDVLEMTLVEQRRYAPDVAYRLDDAHIGFCEPMSTVLLLWQLSVAAATAVAAAVLLLSRQWQLAVLVTIGVSMSAVVARAHPLSAAEHLSRSLLLAGELSGRLVEALRGLRTVVPAGVPAGPKLARPEWTSHHLQRQC
jgi:ATP-binding cassette, subfamily B, bacterial